MAPSEGEKNQILEKLDILIRLLGHQVAANHETLETKAVVLSSLGFQPADIARICRTTSGTIRVRLAEAKKKEAGKPKKIK